MKFSVIFGLGLILLENCSCQSSEKPSRGKISVYEKIKNVVSLKMTQLVDEITELENSVDDIVDETTLPQFSDPLVIGNFDHVPILIANGGLEKIDYKGVEFHGLRSATKAKYRIDNGQKELTLSIPLSKAKVIGYYAAFNNAGNFTLHLWDNVTYIQTIRYSYTQNEGPVQLQLKTSQSLVHFLNSSVEFENTDSGLLGLLDGDFFRGDRTIGLIIGENVFSKIFEEIDPKMTKNIEVVIKNWIGTVANRLNSGLHDVIDKIHEVIPANRTVQVDLGINNPEFEFNNTKIKISSLKLNGIEKFYLNESSVYQVGFYIGADFKFLLPKPNVTVIFIYQNGDAEEKVTAEYSIKHIIVDLVLGKDNIDSTSVYGAELQNCVFGVADIQPHLSQFLGKNFEEGLIRNSTTQLYPEIAEAIEQFFANEVYYWVSRRTGEPKYFRRLRNNNINSDKAQYYEIEVLAMPIRKN